MERCLAVLLLAAPFLFPSLATSAGSAHVRLPQRVELPAQRPDRAGKGQLPESRPSPPGESRTIPVPAPRPQDAGEPRRVDDAGQFGGPPRHAHAGSATPQTADLDRQCRQGLEALGVSYRRENPVTESGCAVAVPVSISTLGKDIGIDPAGLVNCELAEAMARFVQTVVSPAARRIYGAPLASLANASTYVCRPRNDGSKLSEHAFGNALDIAGFTLGNGIQINVAVTDDPKARDFLDTVRAAACGPFKTVLGPGSDADHAAHFHFDLARRRSNAAFCQ